MRILAIADQAPTRPITQILAETSVDAIVTLGDLELSQIRALEDITNIPKLGVYGNHCSGLYMPQLGISNMHMATRQVGPYLFGGFEGCVRYKASSTAKMYTQDEASALLATMPRVDVILVHCPPYGINDEPDDLTHQGFHGLRTYLERERPRFLLHGHTYPKADALVTHYLDTEILYVTADRIIDL